MKYFITIVLSLIYQLGVSQNITQIRTFPSNPTTIDSVFLIADLQFNSSGCDLDTKSHQINGTSIVASTHHCVGIATAICNTTDTFALGILNAGSYNVILNLTSGGSPAPCTPGIIADDIDTLSFTVTPSLGLEDNVLPSFGVYPNPAKDFITLSDAYQQVVKSLKIFTLTGALVFESNTPKERIDVSKLPPGVYYIELYHNKGILTENFIKD